MIEPQKMTIVALAMLIIEMIVMTASLAGAVQGMYLFYASIVAILLTTVLLMLPLFPLRTIFSAGVSSFRIRGPYFGKEIRYSDVSAIEYRAFDPGTRVIGYNALSKGSLGGMFRSSEIGLYNITGHYRGAGTKFIMLELSNGRPVVFNLQSEGDTEAAYRAITSRVTARSALITKGPPRLTKEMTDRDRKIRGSALLVSLALSIIVPASIIMSDIDAGVASLAALISAFLVPTAVMMFYLIWHIRRHLPREDMGKAVLGFMMPYCAVVVAFSILSVVLLPGTGVSADIDGDSLSVAAPFVEEDVPLSDITSVEIREDLDFERAWGYGGKDLGSGRFHNSELGEVTYAAYRGVSQKIVVEHSGGTLVFNLVSGNSTEAFYERLVASLPPP